MKELPRKNPTQEPQYDKKNVESIFLCDLDDINFVDYHVKDNGSLYKTKCVITHVVKGEIVVNHSYSIVKKLINSKKEEERLVVIKGYTR